MAQCNITVLKIVDDDLLAYDAFDVSSTFLHIKCIGTRKHYPHLFQVNLAPFSRGSSK